MKIFSSLIFVWAICLQLPTVAAVGLDNVTIEDLSSSQKTMVIDRGHLDDYTEQIVAKFYVQAGDYQFPKIFLVAEGRLVKSMPKKSIWYLSKIQLPRLIKTHEHLLVLNSNHVKMGRTMTIKQKHVLIPEEQYATPDQYLDENKNSVPDHFLKDLSNYDESNELFETKKVPEADLKIQTFEHLKKNTIARFNDDLNDEVFDNYFVGSREVKLGDITKNEDKKLLDSMAQGYEEKINSEKYGLINGLYKNAQKNSSIKDLNNKISINSVYDNEKERIKTQETINPEAIAKINNEGPQWSADMDNDTLRRYFIRTGLEHEVRRRELAINELDGNEILFHYAGSMSDHTSSIDQNYRNLGYSLGLGYDLHLSRTSADLKNWSIQFFLETGVSDYNVGGMNARGQEGDYGVFLNYYFFNNPLTLNTVNFSAGIGLKAGSIKMESLIFSKAYTYQVLTLPSFQLLGKYRFRAGDLTEETANVGASINFGINLDAKRLSVIDTLDDNIEGKLNISDLKYLLGMSFYF